MKLAKRRYPPPTHKIGDGRTGRNRLLSEEISLETSCPQAWAMAGEMNAEASTAACLRALRRETRCSCRPTWRPAYDRSRLSEISCDGSGAQHGDDASKRKLRERPRSSSCSLSRSHQRRLAATVPAVRRRGVISISQRKIALSSAKSAGRRGVSTLLLDAQGAARAEAGRRAARRAGEQRHRRIRRHRSLIIARNRE